MGAPLLNPFVWLSPAGRPGKLSVFIFHRVLSVPDPLQPDEHDVVSFEWIAHFLARYYKVIPLADAVQRLESGTLPAAAACITFDDGYADNLANAVPILRRHGLHATFFIATGYTDGGRMWNDSIVEAVRCVPAGTLDWRSYGMGQYLISDNDDSRLRVFRAVRASLKYLPFAERLARTKDIAATVGLHEASNLMLTRDEIIELRNSGMSVGAHSVTHPILSTLDATDAAKEISDCRDHLTEWLGEPPELFAYPNGTPGKDYTARDVDLVRRYGYRAAVSTSGGFSMAETDLFQMPRFTPWARTKIRFGFQCARNLIS